MEFLLPDIAYASVDSFIGSVNRLIINPLIILFFAVAFVVFAWGVVEFIANPENDEKRSAGKSHMLWGIVGLVIMLGVFFFMELILNTLGIGKGEVNPQTGEVNLQDWSPPPGSNPTSPIPPTGG